MITPDTYESIERLWTVSETARYLRVSTSWVYREVAAGKLPACRFGGNIRFEPDQIRAFARGELTVGPQS